MSKAKIKHDVVRPHFYGSVRAVRKLADEAAHNFIPRAEPDDPEQTLQNLTCVIEDTGIRMHGYTNVERVPESVSPTGYRITGATGSALAQYVLSPVKKAFAEHRRLHTFVLNMDKGIFMPRPKIHTQKKRTANLLDTLERQQIAPLQFAADGSVPVMVTREGVLPPWIAVRANRVLYRHAVDQLFHLLEDYKPPAGRRLILDTLDMAATSPRTLDEWMVSERLVLDDFARDMVLRTKAALRRSDDADQNHQSSNWRTQTDKVTKELAHAGHIKSIPLCIETNDEGHTYPPFLLPGAANPCGEADVGVLFWLDALQADRQHRTLAGSRTVGVKIDDAMLEFYTDEQIAANRALNARAVPEPRSVAQRREAAEQVLRDDPDLLLQDKHAGVRALIAEALPRLATNPCREPNRALVVSSDTDFLSLVPLYYAQMCYEHHDKPQYCIDNAPIVSIGECNVTRTGWLQAYADYYQRPKGVSAKKRKAPAGGRLVIVYGDGDEEDEDDDPVEQEPPLAGPVQPAAPASIYAHELYDVYRLYQLLQQKFTRPDATPKERLECVASFALFCASCENDFMEGLYFVNRKHMFEAFCALGGRLVQFDERLKRALLNPVLYADYLKNCYYNSLNGAKGKKNKPSKPPAQTTYAEMAALVQTKYSGPTSYQKHMPDDEKRNLMFERLQWWIEYAYSAWQSTGGLLDDMVWGWRPGTIELMV